MIALVRKLLYFIDGRDRYRLSLLLVPMLMLTLLEMASVALILPVIQVFLIGDSDLGFASIMYRFLPDVVRDGGKVWVAAIFVIVFLVKNLLQLGMIHLVNVALYFRGAEFSKRLYGSYLHQPLIFHLHRRRAEILRNLMTGSAQAFEGLRFIMLVILDVLLLVSIVVLLLLVEPSITLISAALLLALAYILQRSTAKAFLRWGRSGMLYEGNLIGLINHSLANIRHVKLSHTYEEFSRSFIAIARLRARYYADSSTAMHISRLGIESFMVLVFMAAAVILVTKQTPDEVITVIGLFGMASFRMMPSLNRVLTNIAALRDRTAYVNELYDDLDGNRMPLAEQPEARGNSLQFDHEIRLEDVSYDYPGSSERAVRNIDLTIRKGEKIGFVGRSGAGKTTIVDIIIGFLKPSCGKLTIDKAEPWQSLRDWQQRIGYVPQDVQILNETVRRNIAFGIPDAEIDDERVCEVVRLARLDDIIARLPAGLEAPLGDGGSRLSVGQFQRVAIARALYNDPQLLVFDEATSALDNETEREVTDAIEMIARDKTVLIIAHRLSTVRNCDRLVFLDCGRIQAVGSYDELFQNNADFRRIAQAGNSFGLIDEAVKNTLPGAS